MALRVTFERDPYVLTHIKGDNLSEIEAYCNEHSLTIVDTNPPGASRYYNVYAEKPNQRMVLLRKRPEEIAGWHIIDSETKPTKKWFYFTYEKDQ